MDPGMECEFQINTRSTPPLPFFRRGPQKLSSGSHKDGWGSAACYTFFTVGRRRGFLWQVSAPLQAKTSGTGRIAPWRGVCSKVMIVTSPLLPLVRAPRLLPTGALRIDCIKRITSRRRDAPQSRYKMKLRARQVCLEVSSGLDHRYSPKRGNMTSSV